MAIKSSGPISFFDIVSEFGGIPPHGLSEYYGVAAGVPAVGNPLSINQFYGKGSASPTRFWVNDAYLAGMSHIRGAANGPGDWASTDFGMGDVRPRYWMGAIQAGLHQNVIDRSFWCYFTGNLPRNFFNRLITQDGWTLYTDNGSHAYEPAHGRTYWAWTIGSNGSWDGAGTHWVDIYR